MLHWMAWERGVKSLYYCRSKSVQRAGFAGEDAKELVADIDMPATERTDYEECLACQ
jgi:ribonucleoside-diphosphate reductase alpha chain